MLMQTVFFGLANIIEPARCIELLKKLLAKQYARKGKDVNHKNWDMVDNALAGPQGSQVRSPSMTQRNRTSTTRKEDYHETPRQDNQRNQAISIFPWNSYTTNEKGHGPEFGYGIFNSLGALRNVAKKLISDLFKAGELKEKMEAILPVRNDIVKSAKLSEQIKPLLAKVENPPEKMAPL